MRVIDDCRRSGLNSAYATTNKLELLDVDVLACAPMAIADAHFTGWVDLGEDETVSWQHQRMLLQKRWNGRAERLTSVKHTSRCLKENAQAMCVLGYFHKGEWKYYTTSRLPFGATSTVRTFNRISRSIHHILCHFLRVVCTCFYDDFPTLSTTDFASEFSAVGITIKLQELHLGHFTLANKEGRIPKIVQMLRKIKQQGRISRNEAAEVQEAVRPKS